MCPVVFKVNLQLSFLQAKHMIVLNDSLIKDLIQFLEHCESEELPRTLVLHR